LQKLPPLPDTGLILDALLLGVTDEVYLIDSASMQLNYVSESALKDTGYNLENIREHNLENLLGVSQQTLQAHVENHRGHMYFIVLPQNQAAILGNIDHDQLRVKILQSDKQEFILIVKNDLNVISTNACVTCKGNYEQKINEYETRCQAMVANTPGVVFQFQLDGNGEIKFIYLTEGCNSLLGLKAADLMEDASPLFAMMNARDRNSLRKRLELSTLELNLLNWEGRIWIDGWQDNKWLDLRAIPRVLSDGVIQWEGIMTNITQSKSEKSEIEKSRRELGELTAHIHRIKEQERSAIAREIHDDLGGNLTAIKIGLSSMVNRINAEKNVSVEQVRSLEEIVDSTFEAVHRISSDLRPNVLDLGIVAALDWQAKEFESQLDITCKFTCNQAEIIVVPEQAITLFRIFQESMSNIVKHAHATHVTVDLNASKNEIVMTISDNGVGIKSSDALKTNSFGLRGMRERAAALQGSFNVTQSSEQGTVITLTLPTD
jgi:two-component system, NarL family, sensor histidine kinase UhpB